MTDSEARRQAHCNKCGGVTAHDVHRTVERTWTDGTLDGQYEWQCTETNALVQCRGCEQVRLIRATFDTIREVTVEEYFPPRSFRRTPPWADKLPFDIQQILDEVYAALHARGLRLAVMGVRTVLDAVLVEKIGDVGTFQDKLKAFESAQFINAKQGDFLFAALDLGSATAHRGHEPSVADVHLVLDIVESMLQQVYVLEEAAARLRARTPQRPPRATAKSPPVPPSP